MMTRILATALLAFLLTACSSEDNGENKKFNTEKKAETAKVADLEMEKLEAKIASVAKSEKKAEVSPKEQKVESYAKNIFKLTTVEGKTLHVDEAENGVIFQEHKDKIVFLLFFGYRCPPCLEEIPVLKKLVEAKGDKLAVIALEVQRLPEEQLKIFKESKKLNYAVLSGEHTDNSKFISYIAQRAQWSGSIPFLVGITPKGEVGIVHVGGMNAGDFNSVFDQLSK